MLNMGKKIKQKKIRLKSKDRQGILSLFNSHGYLRSKRGQPKLNSDITIGIIAKINRTLKNNKKISPFKAWIKITKLKGFPYILDLWFKNKQHKKFWYQRFLEEPESESGIRQNFWRNHLRKYFAKSKKK